MSSPENMQRNISEEERVKEASWDESFANSQDVLNQLAEEALKDHREGRTIPIERKRPHKFQA